jgi:hypothetical protein
MPLVLTPLSEPIQWWIRPIDDVRSGLEMVFEGVELIQRFEKCKVRTLAITGDARRGKSLFLNRIFGVSYGFPLGDTVTPKTSGIWIRFGKRFPMLQMTKSSW